MPWRTTSKSIRELLAHLDSNELVLPEIQREFVWSRKAVMLLFDSLYRALPIGHMLVWKAREAVPSRRFAHKSRGRFLAHSFYGYLLDGQQRLTALALVRDGHDDYPLLLNLWSDTEKYPDYAQTLYWRRSSHEGDPWLVPVAEILRDGFSPLDYLARLRQDEQYREAYEKPAYNRLTQLQQILEYQVGITEFESESYEEATELFVRFNSMGRKLNKGDLAMAELATRVPGLATDDMAKASRVWQPSSGSSRMGWACPPISTGSAPSIKAGEYTGLSLVLAEARYFGLPREPLLFLGDRQPGNTSRAEWDVALQQMKGELLGDVRSNSASRP